VLEDVAETMEPVIADAGSMLQLGPMSSTMIEADVGLLQQLLVNLLDNIALHTPPARWPISALNTKAPMRSWSLPTMVPASPPKNAIASSSP
jgi:signal transduction histidine kinase